MFSSRRPPPTTSKSTTTTTTSTSSSSNQRPSSHAPSPSSSSSTNTTNPTTNGNGKGKAPIKIATVTRTIKVETKKRVVSLPSRPTPASGPSTASFSKRPAHSSAPPAPGSPSTSTGGVKRKTSDSPRPEAKSVKQLKATNGNGNGANGKRASSLTTTSSAPSSSSSSSSASEDEESSEDEGTGINFAAFGKRENNKNLGVVVERDVSRKEGEVFEREGKDGKGLIEGYQLVKDQRSKYRHFFSDPSDASRTPKDWCNTTEGRLEDPIVELEYPAKGAKERFLLLEPKNSEDEYDPIEDLISTIRLTLDHFLSPSQQTLYFSHTPSHSTSFGAFLSSKSPRSNQNSRDGTPVGSHPISGSDEDLERIEARKLDPLIPEIAPAPFLRSLERAKLKHDGPTLLSLLNFYNLIISSLKERDLIRPQIQGMKGLRNVIWQHVVNQVYERSVGPNVDELKKYEAFSDNVYGELLPGFMGTIFEKTGLGPGKVFVDLGSGVGNCVLQAALATGCEAYGFENMSNAARLATSQVHEAEKRFKMWGLNHGVMKTAEADFCESPEAGLILRRADVVLVNNEVFTASLNQRLSLLFLDLPSSCRIVSLKAFASSFTLSSYNRDSPLAILDQGKELRYGRKSVSWKDEGGTYFIGKIDRTLLEKWEEKEKRRRERREEKERREREEGKA